MSDHISGCTCGSCPVRTPTVPCGACGARLPRVRTKAQQRPDSPEMKARIKHVTEECPARRKCDHNESLYGRCVACGMTWDQQGAKS